MYLLRQHSLRRFLAVLVANLLILTGCGDSGGVATTGDSTGRLQMAITDQGNNAYSALVLSVVEVRVVRRGNEAIADAAAPLVVRFDPPRQIDVMQLQHEQALLGEEVLPAGTYTQVRLILAPNPANGDPVNYLIRADEPGVRVPLRTPSAQQSGLKINGEFTIAPDALAVVVIDFDPNTAVVEAGASGNINLKPTGIRLVQVAQLQGTYGALTGTVAPVEARQQAVVRIVPIGSSGVISSTLVDPETGLWRAFAPAGSYTVQVVSPGYTTYDSGALNPPQTYQVTLNADVTVPPIDLMP